MEVMWFFKIKHGGRLESLKKAEPKYVISELRKFRETHSLEGISIRDMIEEGRR